MFEKGKINPKTGEISVQDFENLAESGALDAAVIHMTCEVALEKYIKELEQYKSDTTKPKPIWTLPQEAMESMIIHYMDVKGINDTKFNPNQGKEINRYTPGDDALVTDENGNYVINLWDWDEVGYILATTDIGFSASYNKRKMARVVVESDISSDGKLHYFVYLKHDTEKESYPQKVEVLIHHTDEHGNKVGEDEKLTLNFDQTDTHDKTNGNLIATELILTNPEVLKVLGDAKIKELFGDVKLNGGAIAVTEDIFKKISNSNVITPEPEIKPIVEAVENEARDSEDEDGGSTEVFSIYPQQPEFDEDETEENITPHA